MDSASDQIRAVYEDQCAEINGREYRFLKMTFIERRKVFSYASSINSQVQVGDFSFLSEDGYQRCEEVMFRYITFNGSLLSKLTGHFDVYPQDYLTLITTAMGVICYPFFPDGSTGSQSQEDQPASTTSKPVM